MECKGTNKKVKKILHVQKKFLPLQSRLKRTGFFTLIENTERLKKYKQVPRYVTHINFKRASVSLGNSAKDKLDI